MQALRLISSNAVSPSCTSAEESSYSSVFDDMTAKNASPTGHAKRLTHLATALAIALLTLTGALLPATANAIISGASAEKPWVVKVTGYINGRQSACSGAALNAQIVAIAARCALGKVTYPDGTIVDLSTTSHWAVTDAVGVKLLILSQEHKLAEYPTLGAYHVSGAAVPFPPGTIGSAYGYGADNAVKQKTLAVRLKEHAKTDSGNEVLRAYEINGRAEGGDSGGPLIINNKLVGIMSGAIKDIDGESLVEFLGISSTISTLRQMEHAREMREAPKVDSELPWISATTVENGRFSVKMSSELINSGRQVVMWRNGQYIGEVKSDVSYNCDKTNISDGSVISPFARVHDDDLLKIGIIDGINASKYSEPLYEQRLTGVENVALKGKKINIRLSETLINSGQRVIIWINNTYAAEVFRGSIYYAAATRLPGASLLTIEASNFAPKVPATGYGTTTTSATNSNRGLSIQIGVVPGSPGMKIGNPRDAKLLYSATLL